MKTRRKGGFLLAKVHQLSGRIFARMLKEHGIDEINPAQGRILFVLWEKDAIPIRELSEKTRLEKSTLSAMLDRLEKSGFIRRKPSPNDRRQILITRTEKDRSFQKAYEKVSGRMIDLFYKGFTSSEIDRFEHTLERILDNLDNKKDTSRSVR